MKAQVSLTEYMVLILMIALIAFLALFLMFGFQMMEAGSERTKLRERKLLSLVETFVSSTVLNDLRFQKGSVFEDSKLTAASCADLEDLFGGDLWAEVRVLKDRSVCDDLRSWQKSVCLRDSVKVENTLCTKQNYPECSIWRFCEKADKMMYMSIPVNVYRKMNETTELGVLTVGVPSGG